VGELAVLPDRDVEYVESVLRGSGPLNLDFGSLIGSADSLVPTREVDRGAGADRPGSSGQRRIFQGLENASNWLPPMVESDIWRAPPCGRAVLSLETPLRALEPNRNHLPMADPVSMVGSSNPGFLSAFCAAADEAPSARIASINKVFLMSSPPRLNKEATSQARGKRDAPSQSAPSRPSVRRSASKERNCAWEFHRDEKTATHARGGNRV